MGEKLTPISSNFKTPKEVFTALKIGNLYTSVDFVEELDKEVALKVFTSPFNSQFLETNPRNKISINPIAGSFPIQIKYNTNESENKSFSIKEYSLCVFDAGTELNWEKQEVEE